MTSKVHEFYFHHSLHVLPRVRRRTRNRIARQLGIINANQHTRISSLICALACPSILATVSAPEREREGLLTWDLDSRRRSGTATSDSDLGASDVELGATLTTGAVERDDFGS